MTKQQKNEIDVIADEITETIDVNNGLTETSKATDDFLGKQASKAVFPDTDDPPQLYKYQKRILSELYEYQKSTTLSELMKKPAPNKQVAIPRRTGKNIMTEMINRGMKLQTSITTQAAPQIALQPEPQAQVMIGELGSRKLKLG